MKITRNACPRNCFGTCSILSYVQDDKLLKVTGDPKHGFTQGHLCAKGYAYTQYVYNPLRLKYPMLQTPRGSGNWKRISWNDAYTIIAEKMVELYQRYGSNLASGYNKFSGNLGLLHYAVEGMFNSIGPHTRAYGNICLSTGEQAVKESFGHLVSPIPEDMENSKLIVIWGANPAVTNIHQMKFIYKARKKGGKLVVIDPIFTETAEKADLYVQIRPGTDAFLALGIAKQLQMNGDVDHDFIETQLGWKEYQDILEQLELSEVCERTGVQIEVIEELASMYGKIKPAATWNGIGIQRNRWGGQSIKAINSLVAMSGNLNLEGGSVYFTHGDIHDFPLNLLNYPEKEHPSIKASRLVNSSNFAMEARNLQDPPLKLLWIASRNPLTQDQNIDIWHELFNSLELIITVDLFMTDSAKYADLVLPAASHFEEEDLNVGYWHHWLSINQKTIPPFFEAKSDLKIARELTQKLNEISPQFSTFPYDLEPIDWIKRELNDDIKTLYGINSYRDLLEGPKPRKKSQEHERGFPFTHVFSNDFSTPGQISTEMDQQKDAFPFRLLSPQSLLKIHSQFAVLPWLYPETEETIVELNEKVSVDYGISENLKVKLFNDKGFVIAKAKTNKYLPADVILVRQTGKNSINQLIGAQIRKEKDPTSTFFYDSYVDISKI